MKTRARDVAQLHADLAELLARILAADVRQFPDLSAIPSDDDTIERSADTPAPASAIMPAELLPRAPRRAL